MPAQIIKQVTSPDVEFFKHLYEKDRYTARVFACERKPSETITYLNDCGKGKFQIYHKDKRYGVSVTLKMYASYRSIATYTAGGGKFYQKERGRLMPIFTTSHLIKDYEIFIHHYSWLRFYTENGLSLPMNTVVSRKLYDLKKAIKYMYGTSVEVGLKIKNTLEYYEWKTIRKNIINLENFNIELLNDRYMFEDTCKMAYKLNLKINAAWSVRRLKEEHDNMSIKLSSIIGSFDDRPLRINEPFIELAATLPDNFTLLKTSGQLLAEGAIQRHCVGGYSGSVNSGRKAIFKYNSYTMEVSINGKLHLGQLNGKNNSRASELERKYVTGLIEKFNEKYDFSKVKLHEEEIELPF